MRSIPKFLCRSLPIVALAVAIVPYSACAQQVERIAAIVNDDIVSVFDLRTRMRLVIASAGLNPTPQLQQRLSRQVLRTLIDERLQMQEAKRRNISVTKRDLGRAIEILEKQNRIKPGTFATFLRSRGVPYNGVEEQLRAQIAWSKLIRRTVMQRVNVGPEEIDEELARLKQRAGQEEYRISELLLPVDDENAEADVMRTAERLIGEIRKGAQFEEVARQMSASASASVGGDLGWIPRSSLDTELRDLVPKLRKGEISRPIRGPSSIRVLRLENSRRVLAAPPMEAIIDLRQLTIPVAGNASASEVEVQRNLATLMADTVSGCSDFDRAAREAGSGGIVNLGKRRLGDLAQAIRDALENLPVGKASRPLRSPAGISVFMICDRQMPEGGLPSRDEIEERLRRARLDILTRRYMRDLRTAAVVDIRI